MKINKELMKGSTSILILTLLKRYVRLSNHAGTGKAFGQHI